MNGRSPVTDDFGAVVLSLDADETGEVVTASVETTVFVAAAVVSPESFDVVELQPRNAPQTATVNAIESARRFT